MKFKDVLTDDLHARLLLKKCVDHKIEVLSKITWICKTSCNLVPNELEECKAQEK